MISLERTNEIRWYRQSGAGLPICIGMPFLVLATRMKQASGYTYGDDLYFNFRGPGGNNFYHFFNYDQARTEAKRFLDNYQTNPNFTVPMTKAFTTAGARMESLGLALLKLDCTDSSFLKNYDLFFEQMSQFWENSLYIDLLDPAEDLVVNFIFADKRTVLGQDKMNVLMNPDELSYVQREQRELFAIYKEAKVTGINPAIVELIKQHSAAYYWLQNDYELTTYLDDEYFLTELKKLLADPQLAEQTAASHDRFATKKTIVAEAELDATLLERLRFFNQLTVLRDDRKKFTQIANYVLLEVAKKIATTFAIADEVITQALPNEISRLIQSDASLLKELETRLTTGMMAYSDLAKRELEVHTGPMVQTYFAAVESRIRALEIRGSTASPGTATGRARIILNQSDFPKMQKGDVLVASMTRPEYVPVMKLASAIITDEGGITCHAAIVARELGIPCIIGTQSATQTIADGSMVEVRANHGTVRILE